MLTDKWIKDLATEMDTEPDIDGWHFNILDFARAIEAACKQSLQVEREKAYDALSPDGGVSFVDRQIRLENEQSSNPLQLGQEAK